MDAGERKRRGAWATPPALVEFLCDRVLEPAVAGRRDLDGFTVLDPACGDGRILGAVVARLAGRFGTERARAAVRGVELDAGAADEARDRLGVGPDQLVTGDARRLPLARCDVVLGNPPYLSQLASATTRGGRSTLGGGPYADVAVEFLALAVRLARPDGGRVGLVMPQSVLATRDVRPVRDEVLGLAHLEGLWWAGEAVFDAKVLTCIVLLTRGGEAGPVRRWSGPGFAPADPAPAPAVGAPTWSPLLADLVGVPAVDLRPPHTAGCLGDLAAATADFRQHFYGVAPFVGDEAEGPPLVTVGLLDAGRCAWGLRPARIAGRTFRAPRVDLDGLTRADARLGAWAAARLVPKVLVATQTRVIEAAVDAAGEWLPGVPVITVVPRRPGDLWAVAAVLGAPPVAAWAAAQHVGSGLSAGGVRLRAADVAALPLPASLPGAGRWGDGAARLRQGDVLGCAEAMMDAYGIRDPTLLDWWRKGAGLDGPARERPARRARIEP